MQQQFENKNHEKFLDFLYFSEPWQWNENIESDTQALTLKQLDNFCFKKELS